MNRKHKPETQITERRNRASVSLDLQGTGRILALINAEDRKVAIAVRDVLPHVERAVQMIVPALQDGGRLIYIGAGTSGRLGVLDAAECPPTFGTTRIRAVIAGGARALRYAIEGAEDDIHAAARDLRRIRLNRTDILVGISASGVTPYTLAGLRYARRIRTKTVAITCNPRSAIARGADVAISPVVGPEVIAGSTRMKAGTAQKLVLNMLSTTTMVRLGRALSGWMTSGRLTNHKLRRRGLEVLMKTTGASRSAASRALAAAGNNLTLALLMMWLGVSKAEAMQRLRQTTSPARLLRAASRRAGAKSKM